MDHGEAAKILVEIALLRKSKGLNSDHLKDIQNLQEKLNQLLGVQILEQEENGQTYKIKEELVSESGGLDAGKLSEYLLSKAKESAAAGDNEKKQDIVNTVSSFIKEIEDRGLVGKDPNPDLKNVTPGPATPVGNIPEMMKRAGELSDGNHKGLGIAMATAATSGLMITAAGAGFPFSIPIASAVSIGAKAWAPGGVSANLLKDIREQKNQQGQEINAWDVTKAGAVGYTYAAKTHFEALGQTAKISWQKVQDRNTKENNLNNNRSEPKTAEESATNRSARWKQVRHFTYLFISASVGAALGGGGFEAAIDLVNGEPQVESGHLLSENAQDIGLRPDSTKGGQAPITLQNSLNDIDLSDQDISASGDALGSAPGSGPGSNGQSSWAKNVYETSSDNYTIDGQEYQSTTEKLTTTGYLKNVSTEDMISELEINLTDNPATRWNEVEKFEEIMADFEENKRLIGEDLRQYHLNQDRLKLKLKGIYSQHLGSQ